MIVDRFTKYFYIISFIEKYITKLLKIIILNKLIRYYKVSNLIIINKNKIFIFSY